MVIRKLTVFIIIIMVLLFMSCNGSNKIAPNHHALVLMSHFDQVKSGTNQVIPYHVNMMALYLLDHQGKVPGKKENFPSYESIKDQCRNYIQWYLNHTNPSDQYRLTGTISNFEVTHEGKEIAHDTGTHITRSAASFILLVDRFQQITKYKQMFAGARRKIENIAYLIPHIQDPEDGLLPSNPKSTKKYLESNCVAYAGMDAFVRLSKRLGWGKIDFYTASRDSIKIAILEHLYRPKHGNFFYKQEGKGKNLKKYAVDWKTFYPDSYAHLFPLLFKILPKEETAGKHAVWLKFIRNHRNDLSKKEYFRRLIFIWTTQVMNVRWLESPEKNNK